MYKNKPQYSKLIENLQTSAYTVTQQQRPYAKYNVQEETTVFKQEQQFLQNNTEKQRIQLYEQQFHEHVTNIQDAIQRQKYMLTVNKLPPETSLEIKNIVSKFISEQLQQLQNISLNLNTIQQESQQLQLSYSQQTVFYQQQLQKLQDKVASYKQNKKLIKGECNQELENFKNQNGTLNQQLQYQLKLNEKLSLENQYLLDQNLLLQNQVKDINNENNITKMQQIREQQQKEQFEKAQHQLLQAANYIVNLTNQQEAATIINKQIQIGVDNNQIIQLSNQFANKQQIIQLKENYHSNQESFQRNSSVNSVKSGKSVKLSKQQLEEVKNTVLTQIKVQQQNQNQQQQKDFKVIIDTNKQNSVNNSLNSMKNSLNDVSEQQIKIDKDDQEQSVESVFSKQEEEKLAQDDFDE